MTDPLTIPNSIARVQARRWGRNRYVQAFLIYPRRWLFRAVAAWTIAWFLPAAAATLRQWPGRMNFDPPRYTPTQIESRGLDELTLLVSFIAVLMLPAVVAIAANARIQSTDWRATLLPNARGPHLVLAALFITLPILAVAGLLGLGVTPYTLSGIFSIVVGIAALGAACASLPPKGIAVTGIASVALFSLHPVRLYIAYGVFGQTPAIADALLALSTLILISLFAYLALTRAERSPAKPNDLVLGNGSRWTRRPNESLPTMSLPRRLQLYRLPTSTGLMPPVLAAALLLGMFLLVYTSDQDHGLAGLTFPLAAFSIILPPAAIVTQWTRRLPSLGYELARPATRPQFLRDLAFAMTADWFYWWSSLTLAGLLGCIYASYHMHVPWAVPEFWVFQGYAFAVTLSAAIQTLLLGLTLWIMSFQTAWSIYLLTLPASLLSWFPFAHILVHNSQRDSRLTALALLSFPVAGLFLAAHAYHRWLRIDII